MWKPKQQNCDEYIGKMARIYRTRDDSYEQGILLHIVKTFDKKKGIVLLYYLTTIYQGHLCIRCDQRRPCKKL